MSLEHLPINPTKKRQADIDIMMIIMIITLFVRKWFSVLWLHVTTVTVKTSAVSSACPPTSERGGNGSSSAGSSDYFNPLSALPCDGAGLGPKSLPVGKEVH